MRAYDAYSTVDTVSEPLNVLVDHGFVAKDAEGNYSLTAAGKEVVWRLHTAGRAYVASMKPLGADDLNRLAEELGRAVESMLDDPVLAPRHGSHLAMYMTLAVGPDKPAMVRIEQAILELWVRVTTPTCERGARQALRGQLWRCLPGAVERRAHGGRVGLARAARRRAGPLATVSLTHRGRPLPSPCPCVRRMHRCRGRHSGVYPIER